MLVIKTFFEILIRGWGSLFSYLRSLGCWFVLSKVGLNTRIRERFLFRGGKNISIGKNCYIGRDVIFDALNGEICIGDGVEIRDSVKIYAQNVVLGAGVTIGEGAFLNGVIEIDGGSWVARGCDISGDVKVEKSILGPYTTCIAGDGHDRDPQTGAYLMKSSKKEGCRIIIQSGSWTGARSILLRGVQLGHNTLVGAGAVVTKSFPSNSIIIGNPGRAISNQ